jgi:hypothetical protein
MSDMIRTRMRELLQLGHALVAAAGEWRRL